MKPKTLMWIVVAVAVAVVVVFAFRPASGGGVRNVDAAGVKKAMDAGAQVVDVRTAGEYQMGHIGGAVNVPVDQLEASAQAWDKDAKYVVYCATGSRSATAVETMKALGFKNIDHFAAGIQAWDGELEQGSASTSSKTIETAGKPVLVEFYTDSWPTCKEMKPVVDGLAKEYEGKIEFRRYNVETDPKGVELANALGVEFVPTFVYVNSDGVQAGTKVGGATAEEMRAQLDTLK